MEEQNTQAKICENCQSSYPDLIECQHVINIVTFDLGTDLYDDLPELNQINILTESPTKKRSISPSEEYKCEISPKNSRGSNVVCELSTDLPNEPQELNQTNILLESPTKKRSFSTSEESTYETSPKNRRESESEYEVSSDILDIPQFAPEGFENIYNIAQEIANSVLEASISGAKANSSAPLKSILKKPSTVEDETNTTDVNLNNGSKKEQKSGRRVTFADIFQSNQNKTKKPPMRKPLKKSEEKIAQNALYLKILGIDPSKIKTNSKQEQEQTEKMQNVTPPEPEKDAKKNVQEHKIEVVVEAASTSNDQQTSPDLEIESNETCQSSTANKHFTKIEREFDKFQNELQWKRKLHVFLICREIKRQAEENLLMEQWKIEYKKRQNMFLIPAIATTGSKEYIVKKVKRRGEGQISDNSGGSSETLSDIESRR